MVFFVEIGSSLVSTLRAGEALRDVDLQEVRAALSHCSRIVTLDICPGAVTEQLLALSQETGKPLEIYFKYRTGTEWIYGFKENNVFDNVYQDATVHRGALIDTVSADSLQDAVVLISWRREVILACMQGLGFTYPDLKEDAEKVKGRNQTSTRSVHSHLLKIGYNYFVPDPVQDYYLHVSRAAQLLRMLSQSIRYNHRDIPATLKRYYQEGKDFLEDVVMEITDYGVHFDFRHCKDCIPLVSIRGLITQEAKNYGRFAVMQFQERSIIEYTRYQYYTHENRLDFLLPALTLGGGRGKGQHKVEILNQHLDTYLEALTCLQAA